jgi:hypothetical protein
MYSLLPPTCSRLVSRFSLLLVLVSFSSRLVLVSLSRLVVTRPAGTRTCAAAARLELCVVNLQVISSRARTLGSLGCLSGSHPPSIAFSGSLVLRQLFACDPPREDRTRAVRTPRLGMDTPSCPHPPLVLLQPAVPRSSAPCWPLLAWPRLGSITVRC